VGAHPDDIEIGAAGTVARLARAGAHVVAVVSSDEADTDVAVRRRAETRAGLGALGIDAGRTEFLGLPDRSIEADVGACRLRGLLDALRFTPDVVVTHTSQDKHPDHRNVSAMVAMVCHATAPILGMTVVNSARDTFDPTFFVDTTEHRDARIAALQAHPSQQARGRIRTDEITALERANAATVGGEFAESFEVAGCASMLDERILAWFAPCVTTTGDRLRT
jgi:LmbE family N-acetylglucosaminyl deacetylase